MPAVRQLLSGAAMNCLPGRVRLPNAHRRAFWQASGAAHLRRKRAARGAARRRGARLSPHSSSPFRFSFNCSRARRRPRSPRPASPAPMTQRSPPSSGRCSAPRRNSAPMSTMRARLASMRRPAIAAINAPSAAAGLRPRLFVSPDAPAAPQRLDAGRRAIGAAPDFGAFPAAPARTNLARAPPLAV